VKFQGVTISGSLNREETKHLRTKMQMIFQDPMACLNIRAKPTENGAQTEQGAKKSASLYSKCSGKRFA